ncbi:MAG: CoA transferase, partial [Dehalococcoidia bacterium]|nr:CoA transferase [Dehalococcoidia bacterium]
PAQDVEDIIACPHLEARQTFWEIEDPALGKVKVIGNPIKMSAAPPFAPTPPPLVGQHNQEILGSLLGLSAQEIGDLKARGAL